MRNSLWKPPPVSDQPSITLIRWSVKETQAGYRYFVGYNLDEHEARVSTETRSFDTKTGRGVTRSGRVTNLSVHRVTILTVTGYGLTEHMNEKLNGRTSQLNLKTYFLTPDRLSTNPLQTYSL
jgi:hypothetical protein